MGILKEFKEFAVKGNMIDLAVGMIIGSAFTAIVNSFVEKIVMPVLSLVTGKIDFENMFLPLAGQTTKVYAQAVEEGAVIGYGAFITQVINFICMAFVVFMFVKQVNKLRALTEKPKPEEAPTTKTCPFCKTEISIEATRCPNCTSKFAGFDPKELDA